MPALLFLGELSSEKDRCNASIPSKADVAASSIDLEATASLKTSKDVGSADLQSSSEEGSAFSPLAEIMASASESFTSMESDGTDNVPIEVSPFIPTAADSLLSLSS